MKRQFKIWNYFGWFVSWRLSLQLTLFINFASALFLFDPVVWAQTSVKTTKTSAVTVLAVSSPPVTRETKGRSQPKFPNTPEKPNPIGENLIHNGDTLEIDVLGSLDYDWRGKLDDEGFLSALPNLNVSILALCRTEEEVAAKVSAAYSQFIRDPQIVVRIVDRSARQPTVLLGAVQKQQRFQIERPINLNELVIISGGITDEASGEIKIFRPAHASCAGRGQNQVESQFIDIKLADLLAGKSEANPAVKAGDIITVAEAAPIYLMGGIAAPQRILFRDGITLSKIIASAGGLSGNSNQNKVIIYRRQKNRAELETIAADLDRITRRQSEDVVLQAYDIVEVLQSGRVRASRPPLINVSNNVPFDINKLPIRLID